MTTIQVKEHTKERLLKYASGLQIKYGRKIDYDEAINELLSTQSRRPDLLDKATTPLPEPEKALDLLYKERKIDDDKLERLLRR